MPALWNEQERRAERNETGEYSPVFCCAQLGIATEARVKICYNKLYMGGNDLDLAALVADVARSRCDDGRSVAEAAAAYVAATVTPAATASVAPPRGLEMITLASSSKGNATLVRAGETALLVDAGISARRITQALQHHGVNPAALAGILLTHEHSDHIVGLAQLLKQYDLPVYTTRATWRALGETAATYARRFAEWTGPQDFGPLRVERFATSHDAADPGGFVFTTARRKGAVCTDLGYVTATVEQALQEADLLVLEANHDAEMLRRGPYAPHLKARILGTRGHLENEESARLLTRLFRGKTLQVILAHRSGTNNTVALVDAAVRRIIAREGMTAGILPQHAEVLGSVRIAATEEE